MSLSERRLLTLAFPLSGAVTTLLGPLLPFLIPHWSLTDAQAGQYFLAQFLSSTAGATASGWAAARLGEPRLIAGCYTLIGLAVAALGTASRLGGFLCVGAYGFLLGLSIPAINHLAGLCAARRKFAELSLLNMAWCLGAVLCPPLIVPLLRLGRPALATGGLGGLCLLAGIASSLLGAPAPATPRPPEPKAVLSGASRKAALAAGLFLFLYVGVENGLNGWLPLLARRAAGAPPALAAVSLSAFWAAILLARLLAALAARRLSPRRWILYSLVLTLPATVSLVAIHDAPALLVAAAAAAGLGLGPIFPAAVAAFQNRAGPASARLIGFVFAAAGSGGGALPWLIGAVSSSSGSLRAGMATAPLALTAMLLLRRRL